ncbi:magnesium-transporting ATPase (P-type) [Geomicrobium halophilum]|uniref:Magnesium-transporting ATPase (P-type) n=1 Tax=Geomicrobium halophilum TaxID=549000 RepID=A0A841Q0B3_9BACL|nr:MFS transporter [Geomicrobium halophilum]MBB6448768.1 magnesium-transporting ATPase (P-type) [Geomicrobium halophilum]
MAINRFVGIFGISTLIFIIAFVAFFQLSWGVVTWVIVSEIFPNKIRGQAMSVTVALHWLANLTVSSTFPPLNSALGPMAFLIYGSLSLLSIFFVWKLVPETKGKTLEELEDIWRKETFSDIPQKQGEVKVTQSIKGN